MNNEDSPYIIQFSDLDLQNISKVGEKNASIGEVFQHLKPLGIKVPDGFATTTEAYRYFLKANKLEDKIKTCLEDYHSESKSLEESGRNIRLLIINSTFPIPLAESIRRAYQDLCENYFKNNGSNRDNRLAVAVRSSATAEVLHGASFAGQQETYLNIYGADNLIVACKKCYASLFTNRAIAYREKMGFDHLKSALSVGVQIMIRADKSSSGVMFTEDKETGFPKVLVINGAWGMGENVVKGVVNPDQFYVFKDKLNQKEYRPLLEKVLGSKELKMIYSSDEGHSTENVPTTLVERQSFVLSDDEILQLARWGMDIENHFGSPMDIEWVKDDITHKLFIIEARPNTVPSIHQTGIFKSYSLTENSTSLLISGISIGNSIVSGTVKIIHDATDLSGISSDTILVTEMTEPDWVPALHNAAGIITDYGGRTCHAAIVSRELGIPAVVGTINGTGLLKDGDDVTLSCVEGEEGKIYEGKLEYAVEEIDLGALPQPKTEVMLNLATPESAFKWWRLPVKGIGLARMEFIISNHIRIHPMALVHPNRIESEDEIRKIRKLTAGYSDLKEYFVDRLASGISKIAASQYPKPVVVRTSDFKTNEYAGLIGGSHFEPHEENPMLGWRGASRYYDDKYREGFELECRALKKVREIMGLDNIIVMIPFCRTVNEVEKVLNVMAEFGLRRGDHGLQIFMMCEAPSNYILAEKFAAWFDGFSIGSNDLTQLILGVDRDSGSMAHLFDENDPAVKTAIREVIERAHRAGISVGFCGQAPSNDAGYAKFLVECGIDSISVVPDNIVEVLKNIAEAEQQVVNNLPVSSL